MKGEWNDAIIGDTFAAVHVELGKAIEKFPPFNSSHEGYAVILEEVDELWDEVKTNSPERAVDEAIQVAAMAIRFVVDAQRFPDKQDEK